MAVDHKESDIHQDCDSWCHNVSSRGAALQYVTDSGSAFFARIAHRFLELGFDRNREGLAVHNGLCIAISQRSSVMTELVRQLDKAAAELKARRASVPEQVYAPDSEVTATPTRDGSDRSILFSIGITLGCVLCVGILWALATGSRAKDSAEHSSVVTPVAQSPVATASDDKPAAQANSEPDTRRNSSRSESKKNRSARRQKADEKRFGRVYVLTEPGKTPKMFEAQ